MKKTSVIKSIIAIVLVFSMIFMSACSGKTPQEEESTQEEPVSIETYNDTTENVEKSETVYVSLDNTGAEKAITVSDWLHADKSCVYIADKTTLKNFSVTKGQASSTDDNGNITWQMGTSDVYYQGTSTEKLPVSISIKYFLDDKEISPASIAGKSGNVKIEITMKNNISKEVTVDGKKVTMYAPIVAVGGMVLSYENFSNIEVSNGMSIGGGSYEVVVLGGVPGINESLNLDNLDIQGFEDFSLSETFTISAKTTDFNLGDAYFAMLPLSSLDMDVDLPKTLEDVKDVLSEIQNLTDILDKIDPNQILTNFVTDGTSLKEMMSVLNEAVGVYNNNKELLAAMSQYLTPENIETLNKFINSLDTEQMQSLIKLMSNVPALQTLVDSLMSLSTGLEDVMPILKGISEALDDPKVAEQMKNLPATLDSLDEMMNYLNENKDVLNILSQLMSSGDLNGLTDILDSMIEEGSGAAGTSNPSQLTGNAQELVSRVDEWMKFDYGIYTDAADYMSTSCMFIYKTEPIKAQ